MIKDNLGAAQAISQASWIWSPEYVESEINSTFEFERSLIWNGEGRVLAAITADSRYRLCLNGKIITDGPGRGYPDLYFYDVVDVTPYLHDGENRIAISVLYFGVDTFQYIRGKAGLKAAFYNDRSEIILKTDDQWYVRRATEWKSSVPRISPQQGFEEHYDARELRDEWRKAFIIKKNRCDVRESGTPALNRVSRQAYGEVGTDFVSSVREMWTISLRRYLSSFPLGINLHGIAGVLVSRLDCSEPTGFHLCLLGPVAGVFLDGVQVKISESQDLKSCDMTLCSGTHTLGIAICTEYDHSLDLGIGYRTQKGVSWGANEGGKKIVWKGTGPLWTTTVESNCFTSPGYPREKEFLKNKEQLLQKVCDMASRAEWDKLQPIPINLIAEEDAYLRLRTDEKCEHGAGAHRRYLYDMGGMVYGYFSMEIEASEGDVVDVYFFEHRQGEDIQYLYQYDGISYRNSLRYTAKEGRNAFTSRQRRGFRYILAVLRHPAKVEIYKVGLIEATYAYGQKGTFKSSDPFLDQIYGVSQRTLQLCMEDAFTDCPSFEQTLWVGDAQKEAIFAHFSYGAYDLVEHSWRLVAHEVPRLGLAPSQCPSGWDILIPSFSFAWGIAVWESYWQTGNLDFLMEIYPAVSANLKTALTYCTDQDLFSAPAWNFFDWGEIDQNHDTVLHNSLLLASALDAGIRAARVLGEENDQKGFELARCKIGKAIHSMWDRERGCYADSILEDGSKSTKSCIHTLALALLYDLLGKGEKTQAISHCLRPPESMGKAESPNAVFYHLEALRLAEHGEEVLKHLKNYWGFMLDAGATTFWEAGPYKAFLEMMNYKDFPFPTRSHCHGWAASPVYLLPQLFFNISCLEPGWRKISVKPRSLGLSFIEATVCTPMGALKLVLKESGRGECKVLIEAPKGMQVVVLQE